MALLEQIETTPEQAEPVTRHEAIVIGGGPAGLAAAAMLGERGVRTLVLERTGDVAASWRSHYDRLHLHTIRWLSGLPGMPIDRAEGPWVSREGVVRYLEEYAKRFGLTVRTSTEVRGIRPQGDAWRLDTSSGGFEARFVVIATGFNHKSFLPAWPGADSFQGELVHSGRYRNPDPYRGRDVLVVGTGNSGAEICVDLVEGRARHVLLSVRTPPNILRRDVAGFPSQALGVVIRRLPIRVVDRMVALAQRLTVWDLSKHGLPRAPRGMYTRAVQDDQIPILDVGLIRLLKKGEVEVVPAVEGFEGPDVRLAGGRRIRPDAVIAATGFRRGLESLVGHLGLVARNGRPAVHGARTHPNAPGLFFIGFSNPISGNLREIAIDAKKIARTVARRRQGEAGWQQVLRPARWLRLRRPPEVGAA